MFGTLEVTWLFVAIVAVAGFGLALVIYRWLTGPQRQEIQEYHEYRKRVIEKKGWTAFRGIGSFRLISMDGGQNWYITAFADPKEGYRVEKQVKILGPVGQRCPGLLKHIEAAEKLSILLWPMTESEEGFRIWRVQLEQAGFIFNDEALPARQDRVTVDGSDS